MKMTTQETTEFFRHIGLHTRKQVINGVVVNVLYPAMELDQHWQQLHAMRLQNEQLKDTYAKAQQQIGHNAAVLADMTAFRQCLEQDRLELEGAAA